jgi:KipI family sensor histidine kinase inhibitor
MKVLDYGSSALLVELDSSEQAAALYLQLERQRSSGIIETMPGLRTVLIRFDPSRTQPSVLVPAVTTLVDNLVAGSTPSDIDDEEITIRVDYSGPDLDYVADHIGKSPGEVIAAHQVPLYRIVLIGMAPGFYFLAGGSSALSVPRRSSPRTDVPKGSIGLAGDLTGIYPRTGPGGWQLIGRVVDDLWHPTRIPAAMLTLGTSIRLNAV